MFGQEKTGRLTLRHDKDNDFEESKEPTYLRTDSLAMQSVLSINIDDLDNSPRARYSMDLGTIQTNSPRNQESFIYEAAEKGKQDSFVYTAEE